MKQIIHNMSKIKYWSFYRKMVKLINHFFPKTVCKMRFRKIFGREMNLVNPQDINEKIAWLELYSDTSLWTRCTDKYAVRGYVEECGLGDILVKLYGKWDRADDIDWKDLPNEFVLKTNNGSGTVVIIKDKTQLDTETLTSQLNNMLHKFKYISTTEFHYEGIKPCIIAEELLHNDEKVSGWSTSIVDYKIWCFNGIVDSIWTCTNRDKRGTDVALFDREWNYRPEASVFNNHYRKQEHLTPKPDCLEKMIRIAEILAKPFPVVRVDLYVIGGIVYFGELTFTSLGGTMNFYTDQELLRMGQKIDISSVKRIKR